MSVGVGLCSILLCRGVVFGVDGNNLQSVSLFPVTGCGLIAFF